MQLIDEHNGLPLVFGQFAEHGFKTLFKLPTELGPGQQRRHVERQHAFALERIGHLARHNALGQALDDRGLAHSRLTDQYRVVFGAALQDLDGAADLVVPANHRVQLADASALGQVDAIFFKRLALAFGIGTAHTLAATHRFNGRLQALAVQAMVFGDAANF